MRLTQQIALGMAVATAAVAVGVAPAVAGPRSLHDGGVRALRARQATAHAGASSHAAITVPARARKALRRRLAEILAQAKAAAPYSPSVFAHVDAYKHRFSWSGAVGKMYFGGEPVTPAIAWDGQSEGKVVTATAIWRLIEKGRLKLTDTIGKFLEPTIVNQVDVLHGTNYGPQVTLRELLTHTSGIVDWYDNYPRSFEYLYGPDPTQCVAPGDTPARTCAEYRWDPRDLLALAYGLDPYFAPGQSMAYSETGYFLLGLILERVTGEPVARAQRRLVLSRAGVPHMWFESYEAPRLPLAHAYDEYRPGDENGYDPVDSMSQASLGTYSFTGGGYAAPGTEWDQFFRDLIEGKIVKPKTVRQMMATTPQSRKVSRDEAKDWSGVGAGLFEFPVDGDNFYGHPGYWCSESVYSPRLKLAVSVDFNALNCGRGLANVKPPARDTVVEKLVRAVKAAG